MTDTESVNAVESIWIDPSWLSWVQHLESTTHRSKESAYRPYEIHQHACDILAMDDPNRDQRGDAIRALRRVIGMRVKELREIYQLRELLTGMRSLKDLELLESFGIIRPFMLMRLIELRNSVEHSDSIPPPTDDCLEVYQKLSSASFRRSPSNC